MNIIIILTLFFQVIPFPDLPTPTPWSPPTAEPTIESITADLPDLIATVESTPFDSAVVEPTPFQQGFAVPDIDNDDTRQLFAYGKWAMSSGVNSIMGSFAPLITPFAILVSMAVFSLLVYFWENLIVTIIKLVSWIINNILRLFGR